MKVHEELQEERERQVIGEGFSPEHDDEEHPPGMLARAAACYAMSYCGFPAQKEAVFSAWPFPPNMFKTDRGRRALVKAGALIIAQIEQLDRLAAKDSKRREAIRRRLESEKFSGYVVLTETGTRWSLDIFDTESNAREAMREAFAPREVPAGMEIRPVSYVFSFREPVKK